jgi:hypothetical protein
MAKITAYIPEPKPLYDPENQRQIIEALTTTKQQLNTGYQQELKNEQDTFNYLCNDIRYKSDTFDLTTTNITTVLTCSK